MAQIIHGQLDSKRIYNEYLDRIDNKKNKEQERRMKIKEVEKSRRKLTRK